MVEAPKFDYKYDLALWKSFSARLSAAILVIAAGVFLVAMLTFFYFQEESMKVESATKARTQLHDGVMMMRLKAAEAKCQDDTMSLADYTAILKTVKPYSHSFTLMADKTGQLVFVSDSSMLDSRNVYGELDELTHAIIVEKASMKEVFKGSRLSLLITEPVADEGLTAALVCSRTDILSGYQTFIFYGAAAFVIGLLILFACSAFAIYRLVQPLHLFTEAAMSIAEGNLETPLPEITSKDELLQLRNSFDYMQTSLRRHIEDLKVTTAGKERLQSELIIAHDIQMGMIPTIFPERDDLELFASMTPAKAVGGDLYDFIIDNDELFFIIGDVAGKGVPASLYMAVTRTLFRNLAGNYQSAANIVREMNHAIVSSNDSNVFVTLFVGMLDLRTHLLTFCNAAHNAPVLLTTDGKCRLLEVDSNLPVGVMDHYKYEEQQIDFPEGTALLLYTDGLTEAMYFSQDGTRKLFGEDRVLHDLEKNSSASAIEIIDYLKQHVSVFADGTEQGDDLTLLFLRHDASKRKKATAPRRIIMKNEMAEVGRMRGFFMSLCREYGIVGDLYKSLNLAVEEWIANVVNYAYPKGTRGHVELTAEFHEDLLTLVIKDHGVPFDPTEYAAPDIDVELEERKIGGLGIFLMKSIMDTMNYHRTADGYNVLTLTKRIHHI